MAKLFPFKPELPSRDRQPRLVDLDDDTADEVFAALSSDTARDIVSYLYQDPTTASDVADAVGTSLQNARYHLDKLQSAGLVEEVDTWYSSRGTEMTVYGPTNEPLVVAAGREERTGILREAIARMISAVAILGVVSVIVDRWARSALLRAVRRTADATSQTGLATEEVETEAEVAGGDGGSGAMGAMDTANTTTPEPTPSPQPTAMATRATEPPTSTPAANPTPKAATREVSEFPTTVLEQTAASEPTATAAAGMDQIGRAHV